MTSIATVQGLRVGVKPRYLRLVKLLVLIDGQNAGLLGEGEGPGLVNDMNRGSYRAVTPSHLSDKC